MEIASCIESIDPIGIDLERFKIIANFSETLSTLGHFLIDVSLMIDTC